jgi:hypothetical protein
MRIAQHFVGGIHLSDAIVAGNIVIAVRVVLLR